MGPKRKKSRSGPIIVKELPMMDPLLIRYDSTLALFGPRKCGKTSSLYWHLLKLLLKRGLVMCPTPEVYKAYQSFLPESCLYQCFDEDRLQEILQGQSVLAREIAKECKEMYRKLKATLPGIVAKLKEQATRNLLHRAARENWNDQQLEEEQEKARVQIAQRVEQRKAEMEKQVDDYEEKCRQDAALFIILDDLGSGGAMGNWMVKYIMNNGRHHLALMCILLQRSTDIPAECRGGLDWNIFFYDPRKAELSMIYNKYASIFESVEELLAYMEYANSKGCALVVRRNHANPSFANSVFLWPRTRLPREPEKLGSAEFWKANEVFLDAKRFDKYVSEVRIVGNKKGKKDKQKEKEREEKKAAKEAKAQAKRDEKKALENQPKYIFPSKTTATGGKSKGLEGLDKKTAVPPPKKPSLLSPAVDGKFDALLKHKQKLAAAAAAASKENAAATEDAALRAMHEEVRTKAKLGAQYAKLQDHFFSQLKGQESVKRKAKHKAFRNSIVQQLNAAAA